MSHLLDDLSQSDNPVSLIKPSRRLRRCTAALKRGHMAASVDSRCSCQTCAAEVNDLLVISYLVLERGVWSLPSAPIKQSRRSLELLCFLFFGPVVPPHPLTPIFKFIWLQREDTQCWLLLCSWFVQPHLSQLLPKVSWCVFLRGLWGCLEES